MAGKGKYVWLKGCAGLGNRLYTVCSAIDYCNKTHRTLYIDWSDGQFAKRGDNAFNEYFELAGTNNIIDPEIITSQKDLTFYPAIWKEQIGKGIYDTYFVTESERFNSIPYKLLPSGRSKMLRRYWQYIDADNKSLKDRKTSHLKGISAKNNFPFGSDLSTTLNEDVVVFADFSPSYSEDIFAAHIRLKKIILDKINAFASEHSLEKNTIGIHVRNTDKKPTESIDKLFSKIESIPLQNPQLFLATDNKFVIESFKAKYPNVVSYPKFLPDEIKEGLHQFALYNNKGDISLQLFEESIIDMWLLSKCEYLLYQGNSSFSVVSKILHRNKIKCFNWLN